MKMQQEQNIFNTLAMEHREEIMNLRRNRDRNGLMENGLFIVVADHGETDDGHGGDSVEESSVVVALDGKSVNNITLPENVTSIGNDAFQGCNRLTSIIIPKNKEAIIKLLPERLQALVK